ncbi:hypothetical protein HHO41_00595 [Bacillus sp. DNRA2]|uniref:hypothetical protein n=1 Tax=Bacillus sp. DNRA2 TaxID=2723053 RepID=UPI00145E8712|nr:hypothetical protein [Bacillus sp. DNRA2]NMD68767.1 hypothetical protein [Bacillus sp. DNRA2]
MRNTNCRFSINAIGKGGETFFTHCQTKQEVQNWIQAHQEKLDPEQIRIVDRRKKPLLDLLLLRD